MDNHSARKSMNSLLFYKEHKIEVIDFPPYSPDLNPIENIWEKNKKEIMKKEYQTLSVMTKDIWKEWDNITESQLRNHSASMNDRMKSWLQLKSSKTKYYTIFILVLISLNLYLHLILKLKKYW